MKIGMQFFGGRGGSSGASAGGNIKATQNIINNDFESAYGLPNVGEREAFSSIGGRGTRGTVTPTADDVQVYFDTGAFDNYGTNASAKRTIAERIARDMNGRGFEITISDDGTHLLPDGDTGKTLTLGRSGDKWKVKGSTTSGTRERGGMRGALDRAFRANRKK